LFDSSLKKLQIQNKIYTPSQTDETDKVCSNDFTNNINEKTKQREERLGGTGKKKQHQTLTRLLRQMDRKDKKSF